MRYRKKKWALPFLSESELVMKLEEPLTFLENKPLFLEIGAGKGDFITTLAKRNPNNFYIALDLEPNVLAIAAKKAEVLELQNLKFMYVDAREIDAIFQAKSLEKIYLNFSDPWPKGRHAKRRLTHQSFLKKYEYILEDDGEIIMKTDHSSLYEFTLETIKDSSFELLEKQENYILINEDVETEYEKRFRSEGKNIYRIRLRKKG